MLGSNALFIAGGTAAFGLAVIPWALRQPTRTRTVIGVAYLCVYTFALVRAGVIPIQPVADTTQPELRILLQALQLFWWFVLLRCLVSLGRAFLLFHHKPRQRKFATDLLAGIVYLAGSFAVVGLVFALPVTGLLATSGVVAIVLGL